LKKEGSEKFRNVSAFFFGEVDLKSDGRVPARSWSLAHLDVFGDPGAEILGEPGLHQYQRGPPFAGMLESGDFFDAPAHGFREIVVLKVRLTVILARNFLFCGAKQGL
jgi:hypothetical protein